MERFCDRCGSLVSGDGKFCPLCGAKMGFELNISSDLDVDTGSDFLDNLDNNLSDVAGDTSDAAKTSEATTDVPHIDAGAGNSAPTNFSAQQHVPQGSGYVPIYAPQQGNNGQGNPYGGYQYPYGYQYPPQPQPEVEKMTMGQWVGTILLSTCLGIISVIMLIVWGFSNDAKEPRKSFARAMLVVVPIIYFVLFFGLGIIVTVLDL